LQRRRFVRSLFQHAGDAAHLRAALQTAEAALTGHDPYHCRPSPQGITAYQRLTSGGSYAQMSHIAAFGMKTAHATAVGEAASSPSAVERSQYRDAHRFHRRLDCRFGNRCEER
jgi:hypothetical protein